MSGGYMTDKFDAFNVDRDYGHLCTILGDAVFNLHRENIAITQKSISERLAQERRERHDIKEDKYYEMVIRVLTE